MAKPTEQEFDPFIDDCRMLESLKKVADEVVTQPAVTVAGGWCFVIGDWAVSERPSSARYGLPITKRTVNNPGQDRTWLRAIRGIQPDGDSRAPKWPLILTAPADAIGVRVFEFPITPERVVRALQHARARKDS